LVGGEVGVYEVFLHFGKVVHNIVEYKHAFEAAVIDDACLCDNLSTEDVR